MDSLVGLLFGPVLENGFHDVGMRVHHMDVDFVQELGRDVEELLVARNHVVDHVNGLPTFLGQRGVLVHCGDAALCGHAGKDVGCDERGQAVALHFVPAQQLPCAPNNTQLHLISLNKRNYRDNYRDNDHVMSCHGPGAKNLIS